MKSLLNRKRVAALALASAAAVAAVAAVVVVPGCSSPIPRRNPVGEPFPKVTGESLEKVEVELPAVWSGAPAIVIVGYKQRTQFDIDRWVMGLLQAGVNAPIVELPTIPALVPSMISGWIDDGMRSGIPESDWSAVVTLYGSSAKPVARFTGTEQGNVARVIVLDPGGNVIWFGDAGYSAAQALEVAKVVDQLQAAPR